MEIPNDKGLLLMANGESMSTDASFCYADWQAPPEQGD